MGTGRPAHIISETSFRSDSYSKSQTSVCSLERCLQCLTIAIVWACIVRLASTPVKSSRARSPPTCRCRRQPSTSWCPCRRSAACLRRSVVELLRARRERPRRRRGAEQRDEITADHSITSSARASSVSGTSRPSALAVLRLITSSNLVGACTGSSAGLAPLRMRSTYDAASRNSSTCSTP
jgi:hypothetical protein